MSSTKKKNIFSKSRATRPQRTNWNRSVHAARLRSTCHHLPAPPAIRAACVSDRFTYIQKKEINLEKPSVSKNIKPTTKKVPRCFYTSQKLPDLWSSQKSLLQICFLALKWGHSSPYVSPLQGWCLRPTARLPAAWSARPPSPAARGRRRASNRWGASKGRPEETSEAQHQNRKRRNTHQ